MYVCGLGIASKNQKEEILDVFFPFILTQEKEVVKICAHYKKKDNFQTGLLQKDFLKDFFPEIPKLDHNKELILVVLLKDEPIQTVAEGYLKLHLLSKRISRPHSLNLDKLFSVLPNVVWTNEGAVDLNEIEKRQYEKRKQGVSPLLVKNIDKMPAMCDYVIPSKVRIADASRVRLGAYLGEGTTIMHEGFVNFNAGTAGPNMIEGRISAGVFVEKGTDLGGGCSIMGTLSGGGTTIISVGENCLIGANAGIGISLGDNCTVEAGLYLTAGAKIKLLGKQKEEIAQTKAKNLSGKNDLLFRRNSLTGAIECLANSNQVQLNEILHSN